VGYLFLTVALVCGIIKGYCGKRSSAGIKQISDAMMVNTLRMLFCIFIGLFIVLLKSSPNALAPNGAVLAIAALAGVGTALFTVSWLLSVREGAYMMVDVFLLIGAILPITFCAVLFDEPVKLTQGIGIALLVIAGYIMCTYNISIKGKMTFKALVLLTVCAVSNGVTDLAQKLLTKTSGGDVAVFNLYTYLFAALALGICCLIFRAREKKTSRVERPADVIKPIIGYVLVMAICLFLNSYFKTLAATRLTATEIYPLYQGGAVVLSMLMSAVFFKEKINLRCILGVALSFVALIMINVL